MRLRTRLTGTQHCRFYRPRVYETIARLLGRGVPGRSTGRLEPEMLLKLQVVLSPGRSKTGTCERGRTVLKIKSRQVNAM